MRWHPHIIKWCISIYSKSPGAYEQLSKVGIVRLPSQSTLRSYIHFTESVPDMNPDILKIVADQFNLENLADVDPARNVSLVWDEMQVKSGLAVSKNTGKLVGFCETGCSELGLNGLLQCKEPELATHILVLMVRGLMTKADILFIWFPDKTFTNLQLSSVVWRATRTLEDLGLKVRAWVCDGASSNRKFFSMHHLTGLSCQGITYCTINKFDKFKVDTSTLYVMYLTC